GHGGKIGIGGSRWAPLEIPGKELGMKEITVVPSSRYARAGPPRDMDAAAAALAQPPELPDAVIPHRFPLDPPAEAFATAADRASGAIKVVLEP
ncbi:MAG: Zn-dependent alcohol dehydrogenase, partial [bacterium]|nr:Zn-dependent alcohol dehydrogenase [bacterium]